jgi:hypothetical protein
MVNQNVELIWMIDIDAESLETAEALKIQRDPDSTATSFEVLVPAKYPELQAKIVTVDLEEVSGGECPKKPLKN